MRLLPIAHEYFFRFTLSESQVTGQLPPQFPILGGLTHFEHMMTELGALLTVWGKHEDNQPENARDRRDRPSGVFPVSRLTWHNSPRNYRAPTVTFRSVTLWSS